MDSTFSGSKMTDNEMNRLFEKLWPSGNHHANEHGNSKPFYIQLYLTLIFQQQIQKLMLALVVHKLPVSELNRIISYNEPFRCVHL